MFRTTRLASGAVIAWVGSRSTTRSTDHRPTHQSGEPSFSTLLEPGPLQLRFRGADRLTTYIFAFDATGDNVSDNEIAVNLEGTRRIKVSVGDLGILGLIN